MPDNTQPSADSPTLADQILEVAEDAILWLGNDGNAPMDRVTGGDLPARIWHDFVSSAYQLDGATPKRMELLAGIPPVPDPEMPRANGGSQTDASVYGRMRNWFLSIVE